MRLLDANIFLRALVQPQTESDRLKSQACAALFRRLRDGQEEATTTEAIVAEVCFVLRSPRQYNLAPADIAERLRPLVALRGLRLEHKRTYLRALELWAAYPRLDFEDVLLVAHQERLGLQEITSYDTDFDLILGVQRVEP